MHEYQKESKRGTSNILDEMIYPTLVFKIGVFLLLLKKELPNNSTSENLELLKIQNYLGLKHCCQCAECCL